MSTLVQRSVSVVMFAGLVCIGSVAQAAGFATVAPMSIARTGHTATLLPSGKVVVVGGYNSGGVPLSSAEVYDPALNTWSAAGSLSIGREFHTATLLPSGKVLVAGGVINNGATLTYLSSAELYDPALNTWSGAGSLSAARGNHTATLLPSGKVLVAGGVGAFNLTSAEVYDPALNTWSAAGSVSSARGNHTATLLPSGKVLVAAGYYNGVYLSSAELYDPALNTWSAAGSLSTARGNHTATLLPSGKVLVAGGLGASGFEVSGAEVYDVGLNTWSPAGNLNSARQKHTATLLPSGKVLVTGGYSVTFFVSGAEQYDPASNTWSAAGSLTAARDSHTATLLPSGKVLVAGGYNNSYLSSVELYDSAVMTWSAGGSLGTARQSHTATLLPSGKVIVAGGNYNSGDLSTSEMYDPALNTWSAAGSLATARRGPTATLLPSGKVLVAGGFNNSSMFLSSAEVYDPASNTWSSAGNLSTARLGHTATLLPSGKALLAGGNSGGILSSAEVYDPLSNTWSAAGSLSAERVSHTATLLPSGKVLVAGGEGNGSDLSSAEMYDPTLNTWSAAGRLGTARYGHTATLLPSGKVLIAGGDNKSGYLSSAEVYDPVLNTWSTAGSLSTARAYHTATLLPSGKVLVVRGSNGGVPLSSTEVYDPALNTWSAAGNLSFPRSSHTATLLPSGKVLVAGGSDTYANAELTDDGLQYQSSSRPVIGSATSPLFLGSALSITGTQLKGISEASGGSTNNSASNYPIVQLRSLGNEQTITLPTDPAHPWSGTTFTSQAVPFSFPPGYASATVFTNGIPSVAALILVKTITFTPANPPNAQIGVMYSQTLNGTGGTGPYGNFALYSGALPAGITLSSSGTLSGTPTAGGVFSFSVSAQDSTGGNGPYSGIQAYSLTVAPPNLTFTPTVVPNGQVAAAFNQAITMSGGTAPYKTFTISAGALPAGLALDPSGTISGIPTAGGVFNFSVQGYDSSTGTGPFPGTQAYTLTVAPPAVALAPTTLPNAQIATAFNQVVTGSGGTAPYNAFTITAGALPAGLIISGSGTISGTPTAGGTFNFTVQAFDNSTGTGPYAGSQAYILVVTPPKLTFAPATLPNGQVTVAYNQAITGGGGTAPYKTFTISAGALPAGLAISDTGIISGIPTAGGVFNFTVKGYDSSTGTGPFPGTQAYTLTIAPPQPVSLTPGTLPNGQVGVAYSQTLSGNNGTAPYTFTVSAGVLPTGLTLAGTGSLSGTPTAGGTFSFTVQAQDNSTGSGPYSGSQTYTVTVAAPVITFTPIALAGATKDQPYSQTIAGNGGTAPYTGFKIAVGALPVGLTLSSGGIISGTPATGGTAIFSISAQDSSTGTGPYTANQAFTLFVSGPPSPPPVISRIDLSRNPARANTNVTFTAVGVSTSGLPLTFEYFFFLAGVQDGIVIKGATATRQFAQEGSWTVAAVAFDGVTKSGQSKEFSVTPLAPDPMLAANVFLSPDQAKTTSVANPASAGNLGIAVPDGKGGVIHLDAQQNSASIPTSQTPGNFTFSIFNGSTPSPQKPDFGQISATAAQFKAPGVYSIEVDDNGAGEKARILVPVGPMETGLSVALTAETKNTQPSSYNVSGKFSAPPKSDTVNAQVSLILPAGLNAADLTSIHVGISNLVSSVSLDRKGKVTDHSDPAHFKKISVKLPKTDSSGKFVAGKSTLTMTMMISGTNLTTAGFDTEGIVKLPKGVKVQRTLQFAAVVAGVPYTYRGLLDVTYTPSNLFGAIQGRH